MGQGLPWDSHGAGTGAPVSDCSTGVSQATTSSCSFVAMEISLSWADGSCGHVEELGRVVLGFPQLQCSALPCV